MKSSVELFGIKVKIDKKKNGKLSFSVKAPKGKFGVDWVE